MAVAPTLAIQPPLTTHKYPHRHHHHPPLPKPPRVCFSFSAYAKAVIHHLTTTGNVAVEPGLTPAEFTAIESTLHLTFPPDLRSILQEGLPVGPGFPNWRSSSTAQAQQLHVLISLPVLGLAKEVAINNFWARSWGEKPKRTDEAVELANRLLKESPVLVPIYRHCYIPCEPSLAGNPVFYVEGGDVRIWSFDIAGFFQQVDFGAVGVESSTSTKPTDTQGGEITNNRKQERRTSLLCERSATQAESGCMGPDLRGWQPIFLNTPQGRSQNFDIGEANTQTRTRSLDQAAWAPNLRGWQPTFLNAPAWAAREARRIKFWTEVAEEEARGGARWRWVDEAWCRLREGGWREEEVGEMMEGDQEEGVERWRDVVGHLGELSVVLVRAGWSTEDVVDSLGFQVENGSGSGEEGESNWLDFRHDSSRRLLEAI